MPLFHVGGSLTQALSNLVAGNCLVVLSPAGWRNPAAVKNIWGLVERFKPEMLASVPTVLAATLAIPPAMLTCRACDMQLGADQPFPWLSATRSSKSSRSRLSKSTA
jgi:Acyl-CoA synthetases (AMP-forming)/AMP-acid ligases II